MSVGVPREFVERMAEAERRVLERIVDTDPQREHVPVGTGVGGVAGNPVVCVQVTGFGSALGANSTFTARRIDAAGLPTGDELTIYALTYPTAKADLTSCFPSVRAGMVLRIQQQVNYLSPQWITGWFACDAFQEHRCEA